MFTIVVVFHVIVCILLILVILVQSGKGGGLSSAFGASGPGGMASAMFGGRGASTLLTRATAILAFIYMAVVIGLNLFPNQIQAPRSIIREEAARNQQSSPAVGLPPAPQPAAPQQGAPATPQQGAPTEGTPSPTGKQPQ